MWIYVGLNKSQLNSAGACLSVLESPLKNDPPTLMSGEREINGDLEESFGGKHDLFGDIGGGVLDLF